MIISFIGLDGSGKSTCVDILADHLRKKMIRFKKTRAAYVLTFFRPFVNLAKKVLLKGKSNPYAGDYNAYLSEIRKMGRKKLVSMAYEAVVSLEFFLQVLVNVIIPRSLGNIIILDRYIHDTAVTYAANTGGNTDEQERFLKKWLKILPCPDYIIYIDTPVEICLLRKDDVPDPLYLLVRKPIYDAMCEKHGCHRIDGTLPITDIQKIVEHWADVYIIASYVDKRRIKQNQ